MSHSYKKGILDKKCAVIFRRNFMRKLQVGDVVVHDFILGEVTKVDYEAGFDEVWVTFDGTETEQCFGSNELKLVVNANDRRDLD